MSKIQIDATEYEALCMLRDVTHESLRRKSDQLERSLVQADLLEKSSKAVINEQSMMIEHLRRKNLEQHALILKMQERLAQLEPMKVSVEQPLFARKSG